MKVTKTIEETRQTISAWKMQGLRIGLVPTMGYLHKGHESLISRAASENDKVAVSIFINPIQFGPAEDYAAYPRNIEHDRKVCRENGADLIFHPEVAELYPDGFCTHVNVDQLTEGLCGRSRPGHFQGVCTVVAKLFHIIQPDKAYFGQKDAQQLAVIRRMTRDMDMPIQIIGCPIVREEDGLALSSRNKYLSPEERMAARCLSVGLSKGRQCLLQGETNAAKVIEVIRTHIEREPRARIEYIEMVDPDTMQPLERANAPLLCALAVFIGKTRLIDNMLLEEPIWN